MRTTLEVIEDAMTWFDSEETECKTPEWISKRLFERLDGYRSNPHVDLAVTDILKRRATCECCDAELDEERWEDEHFKQAFREPLRVAAMRIKREASK